MVDKYSTSSQANIHAAVKDELRKARASGFKRSSPRKSGNAENATLSRREESDYHQARVLLLIDALSGKNGSLDGMTKLAKLDFLLRYPVFLRRIAESREVANLHLAENLLPSPTEESAVESRMVRYKYGPWDDRYYAIVGALVGRGLVEYVPSAGKLALRPTPGGRGIARTLARDSTWKVTAGRCAALNEAFNRISGNRIKELIYRQLPEVVDRPHRVEI